MARIVVRCRYSGHYIFTGIQTQQDSVVAGGRIFCPYCVAEHVWSCNEARFDQPSHSQRKPLVRQAS